MVVNLSKRSIQLLHDLVKNEIGSVQKDKDYGHERYIRYLKNLKSKLNVEYYHSRLEQLDKQIDEKRG